MVLEVFYVDPHGMHVQVPLHAPNLDAEGGGTIGNELRAPGGVYWLAAQEDGNIVYEPLHGPGTVKSHE